MTTSLDEESALKHIIVGRRDDDLIVGVGQGGYIDRVAVAVDLGVDQRLARHHRDDLDDIVVGIASASMMISIASESKYTMGISAGR